ncbi:MAG: SMP-30/gluconolactonase/LRE family protein [Polaromonas sp.]|nr:SMP-30/gluconolactonase/LRE family protein [Polaromonas sp.]
MTWQTVVTQPNGLGESPFWHPDEQMLYWIDIPGKQIHRLNVFMGSVQSWSMPSEPGSIAPARSLGESRGLVIALRDGIYRAREWGGDLQQLVKATHDPATTRFNDGKADPRGRFWAGTMYEPRDVKSAQLFSLDCRSAKTPQLDLKAGNAIIANGLAWSPDAATVYWTDTPSHTIRVWDWDSESNAMSEERVFKQWPGKPDGWQSGMPGYGGRPDGAAVDIQGNYYVAMFEGARVVKLSPAGEVLLEIPVPAQCPTMPCFGGSDLQTLYLTTARDKRSAQELQTYPDSGCVFSMRVDVPGLPVNFFED